MNKIITIEIEINKQGKIKKVFLRHLKDQSSKDVTPDLGYQDSTTRGWRINQGSVFDLFIQEEEKDTGE